MTARELASDPSLGLVLRAGAGGFDRPIRWVHATELLDPSPYLRGGELIHTVALWRRAPEDSERFVAALAARGAAGICLGVGVGDGMPDEAPADLLAACDRHDVPLLEVADTTPFVRISEVAIGAIMRERAGGAERSLEREHDLVRAALGPDGIRGVLRVLAEEIGRDCRLLARSGREVAGTAATLDRSRTMGLLATARSARRHPAKVHDAVVIPLPARRGERPGGWLVIDGDDHEPDLERPAVDQVAEFLAIECGRLHERRVRERRFAAGLVDLVAEGKLADADATAALRDLGLDPRRPALVLAAASSDVDAAADVLDAIAWTLGEEPLVAYSRDDVIALLGWDGPPEDAYATARTATERGAHVLGAPDIALGAGSIVADHADLRRGITEARQALRAAGARPDRPAVVTSRELGTHALLLALQADDVRAAFHAAILGPLIDYDARHRTELLRTLDTFLTLCAAWQRTADALHVHVNTLRYRLARIEELTGRDLGSMNDRVDFHLALRIGEMRAGARTTSAASPAGHTTVSRMRRTGLGSVSDGG